MLRARPGAASGGAGAPTAAPTVACRQQLARRRLHAAELRPRCAAGPPPPPPRAPVTNKGLSLLEWTNSVVPQGQLVAGVKAGWRLAWQTMVRELAPQTKDGTYVRPGYTFGGRLGSTEFPAEAGRYHLYLGNACPWCHRVALAAVLRGFFRPLVAAPPAGSSSSGSGSSSSSSSGAGASGRGAPPRLGVGFTRLAADPTRARRGGWVFSKDEPDPVFGASDLWQVYDTCQPGFRGRCTAPLLVDARRRVAVCNESADICRSLNDAHAPGCTDTDLRPPHLAADIDALNARIYAAINNGVYRSGFATSQAAYDAVQAELWSALDEMERRLGASRFLHGDRLTESDVWLFPTVVRLDAMYGPLFKCNRRRIFGAGPSGGGGGDYPHLAGWARDVWQLHVPGSAVQVRDTIDLDAARASYFTSLFPLNPGGIVPAGPTLADLRLDDLAAAQGRRGGGASADVGDACYTRGGGAAAAAAAAGAARAAAAG